MVLPLLADSGLGSPDSFINSVRSYVVPSAVGFATALAAVRVVNSILGR
jgi:hypothetical protein